MTGSDLHIFGYPHDKQAILNRKRQTLAANTGTQATTRANTSPPSAPSHEKPENLTPPLGFWAFLRNTCVMDAWQKKPLNPKENAAALQAYEQTITCGDHDWQLLKAYYNGYYKNGQWYDHGMTHGNLYEANIEYSFSDFTIGAGKILPVILAENRISSSKYKLPELSAVENQLVSDSSFGLWICNDEKKNDLGYYAGIWSNSEKRSRGTWGTWESANANIGLSYKADNLILQNGRIYFDWIHNFDDMDIRAYRYKNVGTKARDIFALYYYGKQGPFELMMEGIWAQNIADYKQGGKTVSPSHLAGLTVMPSWNLSPHVQAVMRYQLGTGSQAVCLNKRYASLVDTQGTYVDTYQAVALGFNFYMYADDLARLKIMTMAEYGHSSGSAPGHGFTGWSFIGGVYTNF